MEVNQDLFLKNEKTKEDIKKKSKKSNNNTGLIVLFVLILILAFGIYYIFTIPDDIENLNNNEIAKENSFKEEKIGFTPPPLPKIENKTEKKEPIFDENIIEEKIKEAEQEAEQETEDKTINVVVTSKFKDKNEPIEMQISKKPIESNLEKISKMAEIKTNFFKFDDKNYYEGDTILDYKVIEVTNHIIKLKNKNNEIKEIQK